MSGPPAVDVDDDLETLPERSCALVPCGACAPGTPCPWCHGVGKRRVYPAPRGHALVVGRGFDTHLLYISAPPIPRPVYAIHVDAPRFMERIHPSPRLIGTDAHGRDVYL